MPIRASVPLAKLPKGLRSPQWASFTRIQSYSPLWPFYPSRPYNPPLQQRPFSSTAPALKKGKSKAKSESPPPPQNLKGGEKAAAADDAFDFSGLQSKILKATEHFTHQLAQLRAGGRFNPEILEELKVQLKTSKEDGKVATSKLKDLAQVVAKGRTISIICHEEDHVKPIKSAVLASKLNLTPTGPSPETPTTFTVQIPPPTGESRRAALASASKSAEEALGRIREARGSHQKKLRAMQTTRKVRADDFHKAQAEMETVVKKGNEEIKKILENSKRVLEG